MSHLRASYTYDAAGNPITSFRGAIDIHDADVHRSIINEQFHQNPGTTTTLAANAPSGSIQMTLTSAASFLVGDFLHIENATYYEMVHPSITDIVGNVITLDRPIDGSYVIGDTIEITIQNMAVSGTLASPQSFRVMPHNGDIWHLTRILIEMTHGSAGDNGLFGNLSPLANGVIVRAYDATSGLYSTFTNWKTNGDMVTDMYDVTYAARSGGGGAYGTNGMGTFTNAGSIVRLDGAAGDYLEILIQDNLSGLTSFRIKAQGHPEG